MVCRQVAVETWPSLCPPPLRGAPNGQVHVAEFFPPKEALRFNLADPQERSRHPANPGEFAQACRSLPANKTGQFVFADEVVEAAAILLTDKNLLFARPPVLNAARVRENWFFTHIHPGTILSEGQATVNRRVVPVSAGVLAVPPRRAGGGWRFRESLPHFAPAQAGRLPRRGRRPALQTSLLGGSTQSISTFS